MQALTALVFLTGVYPLWRAWQANRATPLLSSVGWMILAWAGWFGLSLATLDEAGRGLEWLRYLALCLTCCAGVSVLGARQPGAAAWNLVVLGLLGVLLLPLAEQLIVGEQSLSWVRFVFLAATLAFIFVNYLPTCFAPAVFVFAVACGLELASLTRPEPVSPQGTGLFLLALVPWTALLNWHTRPHAPAEFDRLWRDFRDRYGLVWAARLREQFNRAAANAGWPVHLYWQGLRVRKGEALPGTDVQAELVNTLRAMLKRFGQRS